MNERKKPSEKKPPAEIEEIIRQIDARNEALKKIRNYFESKPGQADQKKQ